MYGIQLMSSYEAIESDNKRMLTFLLMKGELLI